MRFSRMGFPAASSSGFPASSKRSPLSTRYTATRVPVQVLAQDDTMSAISGIGAGEFVITTSTKPIEAGTQVKLADNG